ncbi:MAG: hypothetical protein QF471_05010 [Phycisphaerales bacterium]|nr:hypothetical protein [Phycisphaerales bacterium]
MALSICLGLIILGCERTSPTSDRSTTAESAMPTNPPAAIPAGITVDLIKADRPAGGQKLSLDVRLNKKVSESDLEAIAHYLQQREHVQYPKVFICYYLPGMEVDSGAWATSHFAPDLMVRILGPTKQQSAQSSPKEPDGRTTVGSWMDNSPMVGGPITIFVLNSTMYLEQSFAMGGSRRITIRETSTSRGRRFDDVAEATNGDHWLLRPDGNLEIRDQEGLIATARMTR